MIGFFSMLVGGGIIAVYGCLTGDLPIDSFGLMIFMAGFWTTMRGE